MTTLMTPLRRELFGPLYDEFFGDVWANPAWKPVPRTAEAPAVNRARMDVFDKGDKFEVKVDLPGVKKQDIEVSVEGNRVSVLATVKEEKEARADGNVLHAERCTTHYARSFELPVDIDESGSAAVYENGVLSLTLPKRASATTKRLEIH